LQWRRIRYAPPIADIWEGVAEIYTDCEHDGFDEAIRLYEGENTTLRREFLEMLALAVLTSDNLMPREQELAAHFVSRYAGEFQISKTLDAGLTHGFDLAQPQTPQRLGGDAPSAANMIFFGAGAAITLLGDALRVIEQTGAVPEGLGFLSPTDPAVLTPVLKQIGLDWSGKAAERRQQREKFTSRVSVVPGYKEILGVLEKARAEPFDFTARPSGESWVASDSSPDGFGVVMPAVSGDWVSVGSVVGIEGEAVGTWSVGAVRRMRRLEDGQQHIGVQVLCREAQAVRVMRESPLSEHSSITERMPVDHAMLLTADAARQNEIELLVSNAAPYNRRRLHVMTSDGVLLVRLKNIIEGFPECARIRLEILSVEP
jgi:hypothetical protein